MTQEFRFKNIDETRNYFLKEIDQNELMSRKDKKLWTTQNFIEHFLILAFTIIVSISISAFASLLGVPIEIARSEKGLKICAIAVEIESKSQ